jgi:hypothetical protein
VGSVESNAAAFDTADSGDEKQHTAPTSSRRLLRRPTLAETEQIARACPGLSLIEAPRTNDLHHWKYNSTIGVPSDARDQTNQGQPNPGGGSDRRVDQ